MSNEHSTALATALHDKTLVRFTRPFESGSVSGYVLDIGQCWFLLALVDDGVHLSGFQCCRLSDVRELQVPHPYAAFLEAALEKRGERMPKTSSVSVASVAELLLTANRSFPLVTIHRELIDSDVCVIGRVVSIDGEDVSLLEIGPDASWDTVPTQYHLQDITRVDFGGAYEGSSAIGRRPASYKITHPPKFPRAPAA